MPTDRNGDLQATGDLQYGSTINDYDRLRRVVAVRDKLGGVTTAQYDLNDHVTLVRDARDPLNGGSGASGRTTSYVYDDFGRLVSVSNADIGTWYNFYDLAGNLTASKDNSGGTLNYIYDGLGRRTSISSPLPNESVAFVYDEAGAIAGTSSSFSNTVGRLSSIEAYDVTGGKVFDHFAYDYRGWTLSEVNERANVFGPFVSTFQYKWGDNHEMRSVSFPTGAIVSYTYPSADLYAPIPKPSEVDLSFGATKTKLASGISYFADGQVQGLTYGSGSLLSVIRNKRGETTSVTSGPSATPIVQQAYTLHPNIIGQVTGVNFFPGQSNAWNWTMGYDSLGELTSYTTTVRQSANLPNGDVYAWGYDGVGNRTSETYNGQPTRQFCFDAKCDSQYVNNQLQTASGMSVLDAANPTAPGSILALCR